MLMGIDDPELLLEVLLGEGRTLPTEPNECKDRDDIFVDDVDCDADCSFRRNVEVFALLLRQ